MGNLRLALLFVCLGGLFLVSEAGRFHNFFAANTHYTKTTDTTADKDTSRERYPNGYPDQVAGKYVLKETENKTVSEEGIRYAHGYYNESGWDNPSQTETVPVEKSYKSTYTTVQKDAAGIFDRYPDGYPPRAPATYTGPSLGLAKTDNDWHRYDEGYYGHAKDYLKGTSKQSSFATEKVLPGDAYDPLNRYVKGYPGSKAKYEQGSTYGKSPKADYSTSYTGDFTTLPYPAAGIPFVATGSGCRTEYWSKDVALWPAFFTAQSTVADAFGTKAGEVYGDTTILKSLTSYTTDSYSQLAKSGCTAVLNSLTRGAYPLSHIKVIEKFNAALITKEAASAQALEFEKFNVESISKGEKCN